MEKIEEVEKDMTPKLIGEVYKKFPTEKSAQLAIYGLYECQYCKNTFEAIFNNVKKGNTKSCGCFATHGLSSNKFYKTWYGMLQRCNNPKIKAYKDYGGRGITVCEEWLDVTIFIAWCESTHPNMEGYTLDRIDNDKGYNPENCRWADSTTQAINQRKYKNNTSGFIGITKKKHGKSWLAQIRILNINKHIGSFHTIEEAVLARDNYILENNLPHKLSTDYTRGESLLQ